MNADLGGPRKKGKSTPICPIEILLSFYLDGTLRRGSHSEINPNHCKTFLGFKQAAIEELKHTRERRQQHCHSKKKKREGGRRRCLSTTRAGKRLV